MSDEQPLKLIEKCHAPECGMLYALNQEISDEDFENAPVEEEIDEYEEEEDVAVPFQ